MAAPIIDSVTITPDPVPVGGTAVVTIVAHDPDEVTYTIAGTVTDSSGNQTPFTAEARTSDPLTYAASVDVGVLTQDDSQPNVFYWKA